MGARTIPDMRLSHENRKSLAFLHSTQKTKNKFTTFEKIPYCAKLGH